MVVSNKRVVSKKLWVLVLLQYCDIILFQTELRKKKKEEEKLTTGRHRVVILTIVCDLLNRIDPNVRGEHGMLHYFACLKNRRCVHPWCRQFFHAMIAVASKFHTEDVAVAAFNIKHFAAAGGLVRRVAEESAVVRVWVRARCWELFWKRVGCQTNHAKNEKNETVGTKTIKKETK